LAQPLRAATTGQEPTRQESRRLALVAAVTLLCAGYLLAGPIWALLLATAGPVAIAQVLRASRERWRSELAAGASATARAIADALSGGHSIPAALEAAGRTGAAGNAAGSELRSVTRQSLLGGDQEVLLAELARRAANPTWDAIVAAIALHRRAGGDLAQLLRRIADVADERERVEADARTLTAQARFTARLVAAMPVAGLALAEFVAPGGIAAVFSNPVSTSLLGLAAVILLTALYAIGRIARPLQ
jgi:tight adherence protein B